jgi:hypothetical protein
MLPTDLSIAQARIRDLLAEAETSRLAARLRKTGRRPARGAETPSDRARPPRLRRRRTVPVVTPSRAKGLSHDT